MDITKTLQNSCPYEQELPTESPCVYALGIFGSGLVTDSGFEVAYIGQTQDLRQRIEQHASGSEDNPRLTSFLLHNADKVMIIYTILRPLSDRKKLENELIRLYNPPYNN